MSNYFETLYEDSRKAAAKTQQAPTPTVLDNKSESKSKKRGEQ